LRKTTKPTFQGDVMEDIWL